MHRDRTLGIAMAALSAGYYGMATSILPSRLADSVGPQGLPKVYAVLLALLSIILIARSRAREPRAQSPKPEVHREAHRIAGMLAIGIVYIVVAPWLGYLLSIAGLILATTYYQGRAVNRSVVLVALGGGIFFWLLFVILMGIQQPAGWFPPPL